MSRLRFATAAALLVLAAATLSASEPPNGAERISALGELFTRSANHLLIQRDGQIVTMAPPPYVVVARLEKDGRVVAGCFAREDAARQFLERAARTALAVEK